MPFPASYVNGRTMRDSITGNLSVNLDTDNIKVALFTNDVTTGDKNAVETYGSGNWTTANEVSSANYTAGGKSLSNPTVDNPIGGKYSLRDLALGLTWEDVSFTARGALVYDVTASNRVLAAINFGEDKTVIGGTFSLNWDPINYIFSWSF